jgi:hypothetical protein
MAPRDFAILLGDGRFGREESPKYIEAEQEISFEDVGSIAYCSAIHLRALLQEWEVRAGWLVAGVSTHRACLELTL